ncbi:cytochrome P450 2J2-like isoform X3 [Capricornis sumatraensis]|uniref:cytochrome P450 2J2-like isoform X3 n=1 Tax=Capricornis sumatraensis TaxID=34865 RepID=UPI00360474F6
MALNPQIQEKAQAEINRVLSQSQKLSTAARESIPYTNTVIHEVLKMGNIVPLNVPREVAVNTTLNGYHLPKIVKKYGSIIRLDFGAIHSILITGLPYIKEALVYQEQNFVNRPMLPIQKRIFNNKGLIRSNGQVWKEQRRFTLTTLRNFGLGRKSLEERIQEELTYLIQAIGEENGQPFDPHFIINNAVSNIICSITFGERFDYQDDQFQELLRLLDEILCIQASVCCQLYNAFPRIMHFLPGSHQTLFRKWEKLKMFVANVIENHRKDWNPAAARDFIDAYLQEIEKHKGNATSSFHDENLIYSTLDLFLAGTETTSTTLRWGLLFMAMYPEIQEKVQAEIDRVLGQSQKVSTAARESMPYTNAVIHEVQRMGNIIPMNVPREVTEDTTLNGYHLVKESGCALENNWPELSCLFSLLHFCKILPSGLQRMRS